MLTICLFDINKLDLEIQKIYLNEISQELNTHFKITIFNKPNDILKHVISNSVDIVLLEADILEISSILIGKKVKALNPYIEVIFLSSNKSYALNAFNIGAAGYIVKPIVYSDFRYILKRTITIVQAYKELHTKTLTFNVQRNKKRIIQNNILYIEKYKNKCNIKTSQHEFSVYISIKDILTKLDNYMWQINQGTIINSKYIEEVRKNEILLQCGKCITMGRKYREQIKKKLNN